MVILIFYHCFKIIFRRAQNESLKQEIVAQEVELKSQITILEKKAHENWVAARQAERRMEDAKQEAAQLRNRLTLRERTVNEEKGQNSKCTLSSFTYDTDFRVLHSFEGIQHFKQI